MNKPATLVFLTATVAALAAAPPIQDTPVGQVLPPPLEENIILNVKGTPAEDYSFDMSITGCGPEFVGALILHPNKDGIPASHVVYVFVRAVVTETASGYLVQLDVQSQTPQKNSNGPVAYGTQTYNFTETAKLGAPDEVARSGWESMTLLITKPASGQ